LLFKRNIGHADVQSNQAKIYCGKGTGNHLPESQTWKPTVARDSRIDHPLRSAPHAFGLMNPSRTAYQQIGIYQPKRGTIFGKIAVQKENIRLPEVTNPTKLSFARASFDLSAPRKA